ncbi:MAG: tyrosine-type recombinase/integrase [Candidatus Micrarchaeaceae archaeon]
MENRYPIWIPNSKGNPQLLPLPKQYSEIGAKRAKLLTGMRYRTRNYMAITEKEIRPDGVSRAVLDMANSFEKKYASKWVGRHILRPADLERYVLWLYATGSRKREPFIEPYPKVSISKPKGLPWRVVKISRVIEKAFVKGTDERVIHEQNIPIFDQTDDQIWRKALNDYEDLDLAPLFKSLAKHDAHNGITSMVQNNFRCDMREEFSGRLIKNAPITPHALRHHRAYNLYIERGLDKDLVVSLFGWKDDRMLDTYAYINRSAKGRAQIEALKKFAASSKAAQA